MNIKGFSSQINALGRTDRTNSAGGIGGFRQSSRPQLQNRDPGLSSGFPKGDVFESGSTRREPGLAGVLKDSLQHAGISQSTSQSIMDAVHSGVSLDSALQSAGVTPEQHRIVMDSVRAQDPRYQKQLQQLLQQ
jgi:hypothetical protein